ncbi:MAG: chloride channel protein [Lentisphaeria bacterium]
MAQLRLGSRRRILLLSVLVGALSAVVTWGFLLVLDWVSAWVAGRWMGVPLSAAACDPLTCLPGSAGTVRKWAVLLLPALGGLASGLLVSRLAPSASGDGVDATIGAFHRGEGRVPLRVSLVKLAGSILTIGSGGSAGREGPMALTCAGIGSALAGLFKASTRERRMFMLAGTAAGLGAIFRIPLGGAISAVEILYKEDFESSSLLPCVVSSVTGYTVFQLLLGLLPCQTAAGALYAVPAMELLGLHALPFVLGMGLLCALAGKLYANLYRFCRERLFPRLPVPVWLKPALGGLGVGLLALVSVDILGTGQGLVSRALEVAAASLGPRELLLAGLTFLGLVVLKMTATSLTIGSGGSGGIFGPTLVIGAMLGAGAGLLAHALLPLLQPPPIAAFVLLGMAGFFAGVASAPIGAVVMVCELGGSYTLLAPLLIICVIAMLLGRGNHMYENQVENRFHSPAYRRVLSGDLLADVTVDAFYHRMVMPTVNEETTGAELRRLLANQDILFPLTVVNRAGRPVGILTMGNVRPVYFDDVHHQLFLVRDMMSPLITCTPEDPMAAILRQFEGSGYSRLPVVSKDDPNVLLGYIQHQDVMIAYETELARRRLEVA